MWPFLAGLALGLASVFVASFGLIAIALVGAMVFVAAIRTRRFDFLGGYLLGFGLLWSFLIGRMVANGIPQGNDFGWIAFGLALVAMGVTILLAARFSTRLSHP